MVGWRGEVYSASGVAGGVTAVVVEGTAGVSVGGGCVGGVFVVVAVGAVGGDGVWGLAGGGMVGGGGGLNLMMEKQK